MNSEYENQPSLLRDAQKVLWDEWDPIGLKELDETWPNTEYDSYAAGVISQLYRGADDAALGAYLGQIEVERMGMERRDAATLTDVARRIRAALAWKAPNAVP